MYSGFNSNFSILSSTMNRGEIDFFFFSSSCFWLLILFFTTILPSLPPDPTSSWTCIGAIQLSLSLSPVTVISFTLVLCVLFELSNDRTSLLKTKVIYIQFCFCPERFQSISFFGIFFIVFFAAVEIVCLFFAPLVDLTISYFALYLKFFPLVVSFYKKKTFFYFHHHME